MRLESFSSFRPFRFEQQQQQKKKKWPLRKNNIKIVAIIELNSSKATPIRTTKECLRLPLPSAAKKFRLITELELALMN